MSNDLNDWASSEASQFQQFLAAARLPLRALRFLKAHRALWPIAAIPAAISALVLMILAGTALFFSGDLLALIWAKPEGWLVVFWWMLRIIIIPLLLVISYFTTLMTSAVLASPVNDKLAERTEGLMKAAVEAPASDVATLIRSAARGALQATANIVIFATVMVPIMMLNLVPGIGSVASSLLGATVGAFFLALEYTDWTLERRNYGWRRKWASIWRHRGITLGFGLGTTVLMWIPVVNFLSMPVAVIGGAALAVEIARRETSLKP